MTVLVLGGRGFIGNALVSKLIDRGIKVRLLTRIIPCPADCLADVEYLAGDLLEHCLPLDSLLEDCDVIINCAGEIKNQALMYPLHVEATSRLVKGAKFLARQRRRAIHWVQLSSVGAYGPPNGPCEDRVVYESSTLSPKGIYEETKTLADEIIQNADELGVFTYSILRPSNVFGPYMPNDSLRQLARTIKKGLFFYIGRPGAISTYVHVDDVVQGLIECTFNSKAKGNVFNISFDCPQEDLMESLASAVEATLPRVRLPFSLAKLMVIILCRFRFFPLTESRLNSLVARTHYSSSKALKVLALAPTKYPPDFISDVFVP